MMSEIWERVIIKWHGAKRRRDARAASAGLCAHCCCQRERRVHSPIVPAFVQSFSTIKETGRRRRVKVSSAVS